MQSIFIFQKRVPKPMLKPKDNQNRQNERPTVFQDYPNRSLQLGDEAKRMIQYLIFVFSEDHFILIIDRQDRKM